MRKDLWGGVFLIFLGLLSLGGIFWIAVIGPNMEQNTVQTAFYATMTAEAQLPSSTPVLPTATRERSATATPTSMPTEDPTETVIPTNTPEPPATETPTVTPTPTATPVRGDFLLAIPKLKLKWVVHEITQESLEPWGIPQKELDKFGVVRFPHLASPGQEGVVGIIGHLDISGAPFLHLSQLSEGDTFTLQLKDGSVLQYRVFGKEVVKPSDVTAMDPKHSGAQEVHLMTCTLDIKNRTVIYAERTNITH